MKESQIQPLEDRLKKAFVSHLFQRGRIPQFDLRFDILIKFSQFSKVCISKYGSRSEFIKTFDSQQNYLKAVRECFTLMKDSIYNFVFGESKTDPKNQNKHAEWRNQQTLLKADKQIQKLIVSNIHELLKKYSEDRIAEVKNEMAQLYKNNQFDIQRINKDRLEWQRLLEESLNINVFIQVMSDINETAEQLKKFRKEFCKTVKELHSGKILKALSDYSLHNKTEYQHNRKK